MRRSVMMVAALGLLLALYVPFAPAQTDPAAQDSKKAEADAYKAWYDANAAKDIPKAVELAKAYLEKFPNGQYADYLKNKWMVGARGILFSEAMKAKNTAEMIRLGREALAADPQSVDYAYLLAIGVRQNEISANPANYAHSAEATEFSKKAIELIEGGKVPTVIDKTKWNQQTQLAYLYQTMGIIEQKNKNGEKAIEYYKKAAALEPTNPAYFFACGQLHQEKYLAAVQKFQAFPEPDRATPEDKPEVKAALDDVNNQADMVIDCWARFMGLTAKNNPYGDTRAKVEKALVDLYKYRHPDSPDGLQKLIDQYSNAAPPASTTGTPTSTKP